MLDNYYIAPPFPLGQAVEILYRRARARESLVILFSGVTFILPRGSPTGGLGWKNPLLSSRAIFVLDSFPRCFPPSLSAHCEIREETLTAGLNSSPLFLSFYLRILATVQKS